MISTIYGSEMINTEKADYQTSRRIAKLISIEDYNKNRELADQSDMPMSFSESLHKSLKWYNKFLFHLLDISLYNACVP
jgi:hypothetical protein